VVVHGVPAGLGTYANWDERLDGLLAWSVMSLQAVKAVEIGRGSRLLNPSAPRCTIPFTTRPKIRVKIRIHDPPVSPAPTTMPAASEGGVSNGEDIVVRGYLKPISTLRRPLESVRFDTARGHQRKLRTQRHLRGSRRRRGCGSHGGSHRRRLGATEVRRRFGPRDEAKF